jgi:hypothetical protein
MNRKIARRQTSTITRCAMMLALALVALSTITGCHGPMLTRTTDIRQNLALAQGQRIGVAYFAVDGAQLPTKTDDWYKGWQLDLSKDMAEAISAKLNGQGFQTRAVPPGERADIDYLIRGRYVQIEPGKKALRGAMSMLGGWAGDAGKAYLVIEGDMIDKNGSTVMTFYNKEVPHQSFLTDSAGAFSDAIAETSTRFANEMKERLSN